LSKKNVIIKLSTVFEITNKIKDHNIEVELFLGDLANYLYNLEVEEYYEKAIDHFLIAKTLAPADYRVYWFLGNHYALSANQIQSIESYQIALKYMPVNKGNSYFWNEYSFACTLARMPGTARYAAHQISVIAGKTTQTEDDVNTLTKKSMKIPPSDTSMEAKDVWSVIGKTNNKLILLNKIIGIRLAVDSLWNLDVAGFTKQLDYISIKPKEVIAKNGKKIGYSMLLFAKIPDPSESLSAFYEKLTIKTKYKKPINFYADKFKNAIAFELQDPTIYPNWGGGHSYALALERDYPDFPGKAIELPIEAPKSNDGKVNYYEANNNFSRVNAKLFYYILLDSCEDINEESLAVFKEFLDNLIIE
jgi:tetratricopeptide (TPR) repeat protein